ncbi:protein of unknown function [Xenorhabdus doucetiae]|uniref:Uncharacterized protein n=1 Tax=Xenorhabdus doucetiae TaxID=351671 RepID=A0A068QMP6_9GAMM|nr:protein of unknown function [Xenorhabdus doucetiae]
MSGNLKDKGTGSEIKSQLVKANWLFCFYCIFALQNMWQFILQTGLLSHLKLELSGFLCLLSQTVTVQKVS